MEKKIKIAFINLFVNAIESMNSEDGKLTIKTQFRGNHCQIEICDNGEGIAKENLERIFEPFFTQKNRWLRIGAYQYSKHHLQSWRNYSCQV